MKLRKLVEDGKIILDGIETEAEKEEIVFVKTEIIQDYESQFGLDIVFILKALRVNTIYKKNKKKTRVCHNLALRKHNDEWCLFFKTNHYVRTKDYGKTWALTKEELETK